MRPAHLSSWCAAVNSKRCIDGCYAGSLSDRTLGYEHADCFARGMDFMTTQRKESIAVSRLGVNFARQVVEAANCTFLEVEQSSDLGNDAYIEFVTAEEATGCCIAVQIKSGTSFLAKSGGFFLPADRDHFEYWSSHVLPICGIVFDPTTGRAGWCDVTRYLRENAGTVEQGPFRIPSTAFAPFSSQTFSELRAHFIAYARQYSDDAHFGAALDRFAPLHSPAERIAALRSLFSFHRNRAATWCYVASLLRGVENPDVLHLMVVALAHLPGHGDILWHRKNEMSEAARLSGVAFMKLTFGRDDVVKLLSAVDEHGFERGTIGQAAHAVINVVRDVVAKLEQIAFDETVPEGIRYAAIFLYVFYAQDRTPQTCITRLEEFRRALPDGLQDEIIVELMRTIKEHGAAAFY